MALQFHEERQKNPELFQSRLGNKLWYQSHVDCLRRNTEFWWQVYQIWIGSFSRWLPVTRQNHKCQSKFLHFSDGGGNILVVMNMGRVVIVVVISAQVDGYELDLPDLEGVIILNITNYAGGVSLWEHDPTTVCALFA